MITSTLGLEVIVYGTTKTNRVVETHAVTKIPLDGDWIHLTVTHDGKETVSFYINGKLEKSTNQQQREMILMFLWVMMEKETKVLEFWMNYRFSIVH